MAEDTKILQKIQERMRSDWDRRISHDYRFWMSDGHANDEAMWASGARDFGIITHGIPELKSKRLLDLGCGVGRLLKSASAACKQVYGVDVSPRAVMKAQTLLGATSNLSIIAGDGVSLAPLADQSVDVVISFAALVSMPALVTAQYLREIHRILTPNGLVRIQVYLGNEQVVGMNDTLHLRSFNRDRFVQAMSVAGFDVTAINDLTLPFQVSFKETGLEAVIVSLSKSDRAPASATDIYATLLPQGEPEETDIAADPNLEYWVAINYAGELADSGDTQRAKEALTYAASIAKNTTIDVRDVLGRIVSKISEQENQNRTGHGDANNSPYLSRNLAALRGKMLQLAERVASYLAQNTPMATELRDSLEGPVLFYNDQCLDHAQRPKAAGDTWAKRSLSDKKYLEADSLVIIGCGGGYHVRSVGALSVKPITVVEPKLDIFVAFLKANDVTDIIARVTDFIVEDTFNSPPDHSEFLIRPQHHALFPQICEEVRSAYFAVRGFSALHPSIGVVGPIQGGTLPIMSYTTRGLTEIGQKVKEFDVSGFSGGFQQIDRFFIDKYRVAAVHGVYVETVARVVFESILEKPVDILILMAQAPFTPAMITELRKRGVITVLWFLEDYLRFTYWKETARYFDFVFTIQKGDCLTAIKQAGAGEVHYLPPGCDPGVHYTTSLTQEERDRWGAPISFVGAGYHNRQQMFAYLADLPFKIWGTEWPGCRPFDRLVQEQGRRLTPAEYVKIFNATDININLHSSTERDGVEPFGDFVNPRTFELAACGAFQLVDERSLLPELFEVGKEIVTFKDIHDLKEKLAYYRDHPEERAAIAAASKARVLRDHTYSARLKQMLSIIYNAKFDTLKKREDSSPWHKMKQRASEHSELSQRCEVAYSRGDEAILDNLVKDIVQGQGKLTETEQKLLFLHHVKKQIVRMKVEELGPQAPEAVRRGSA
jgi:spore maturation protein CgeB